MASKNSPEPLEVETAPRRRQQPGSFYPRLAPNRPIYVTARLFGVFLSLALISLATVSLTALPKGRGEWSAPILSPAISTLFGSGFEVWRIVRCNFRSSHWYRMFYDAALGIGYAIAFGYLVKFTKSDISRSSPTSTGASAAVGAAVDIMMLAECFLQVGYVYSGVMEMRRRRENGSGFA